MNKTQLYKKAKTGKISSWTCWVEDQGDISVIFRETGYIDGKKTLKKTQVKRGTNVGRSNEKSIYDTACFKANNFIKGQIEDNYVLNLDEVDLPPKFLKPSLAKTYDEKSKKHVKFPCFVQPKLDGCLSGEWVVEFEDGSKKTMQEIVDNEIFGKVKSYDTTTREILYKDIVGHSKKNKTTKFFRIETSDGEMSKPLTGNHLIWTETRQEWIRVDELTEDDVIVTI